MDKKFRKNQRIRSRQVSVIDENGQQLGVLDTDEALRLAQEKGLDLVEVGPGAKPPVTKIMDYGKFMYQKEKEEKQRKKEKTVSELKTVQIGFKTDKHDLETKVRQIDKFLSKGHRVRVEIKLRGREKARKDMARDKLLDFLNLINQPFVVEGEPRKTPYGWGIGIHYGKDSKNKQGSQETVQDNR